MVNINSLPMAVNIAPQTELTTYTGLYYFASTAAAVLGPFLAGLLIDALGKDLRSCSCSACGAARVWQKLRQPGKAVDLKQKNEESKLSRSLFSGSSI